MTSHPCRKHLLVVLLFVSTALSQVGADTYRVDPAASRLAFSIQHMGFNTVRGEFGSFTGEIAYDGDAPSLQVSAHVEVTSIDTGIGLRDRHLRGEDWFHADAHPLVHFRDGRLVDIRTDDTETDATGIDATLEGQLEMRGVSRTVRFPVRLEERASGRELLLTIGGSLDHRPFGVVPDSAGGRTIGDTVTADIRVVARRD